MRRFPVILAAIVVVFLALLPVVDQAVAAPVEPDSQNLAFIRGTVSNLQTPAYEGTTLRIHFQCFSDTEGVVTQDLTSVTNEIRVGIASTNVAYEGTITNATAGQGYVDILVPLLTNISSTVLVQMQLTGTNLAGDVTYIYPLGSLTRSTPLQ